jgi:hypothetical protein
MQHGTRALVLAILAALAAHATAVPARALLQQPRPGAAAGNQGGAAGDKEGAPGCMANKEEAACNAASECTWVRENKCVKPAGCMVNKDQATCEAATGCKWEGDKCFKYKAPAVGEPPKQEERPQDCAATSCANGGVCFVNPRGNPATLCNCTGTGFCGMKCGTPLSECQRQRQEKEEMAQSAEQAGRAGRELEREKDKCTDAAKKMLCPAGVGPNSRTCVEAISDCFITGGAFNATLMEQYKTAKAGKCTGDGQKFCDQEDVCIGRGATCAPQTKCPDSRSYRCANWKCAVDAAGCGEGARPDACPEGQMRCPDGLCYAASGDRGLKECAKQGVQWEAS